MANHSAALGPVVELAQLRGEARPFALPPSAAPQSTAAARATTPPPRRRMVMPPGLDQALTSLSKKARFMKRARFNAQARYEEKNTASILALAVVSVLAIAISMYSGALGTDASLKFAGWSLGLVANIMSLLALTFGFIVALGNYQDKALRLQRCAMDLNRLLDEIENGRNLNSATVADLYGWTRAYHDIINQCPYNHDDVDTEKAGFDRDTTKGEKRRNTLWRLWNVWGIHALPFVALAAFWQVVG